MGDFYLVPSTCTHSLHNLHLLTASTLSQPPPPHSHNLHPQTLHNLHPLTASTLSQPPPPHTLRPSTPSQPPHPHTLRPSTPSTPSQPHTLTSTSPECRNRLWGIMTAPTTPRPCETASDVQFAHIGITAPLKTSNWLSASMAVWMYYVCVGDRIIICKLSTVYYYYILQRSYHYFSPSTQTWRT